jgi:hypothetical protein
MSRSDPLRRVTETPRSPATKTSREGFAGEVVAIRGEGALTVRRRGEVGTIVETRLGILPGYRPSVGDVVAVTFLGKEAVVLGVLEAAAAPVLAVLSLPDGGTARLVSGGLEVADAEGRIVVRYADGTAEIAPSSGDLRLSAPSGRVVIAAGLDVAIEAQRDVTVSAQRSAETRIAPRAAGEPAVDDLATRFRLDAKGATVAGASVEVRSRRARLTAGVVETIAREMRTNASLIETTATALETTAERIVTKAQSVAEDVSELLETRAGRVRSIVRGVFSLRSKTTTMKSKDDTAIDGRHVLLG